jgi:hypothetical protein
MAGAGIELLANLWPHAPPHTVSVRPQPAHSRLDHTPKRPI